MKGGNLEFLCGFEVGALWFDLWPCGFFVIEKFRYIRLLNCAYIQYFHALVNKHIINKITVMLGHCIFEYILLIFRNKRVENFSSLISGSQALIVHLSFHSNICWDFPFRIIKIYVLKLSSCFTRKKTFSNFEDFGS